MARVSEEHTGHWGLGAGAAEPASLPSGVGSQSDPHSSAELQHPVKFLSPSAPQPPSSPSASHQTGVPQPLSIRRNRVSRPLPSIRLPRPPSRSPEPSPRSSPKEWWTPREWKARSMGGGMGGAAISRTSSWGFGSSTSERQYEQHDLSTFESSTHVDRKSAVDMCCKQGLRYPGNKLNGMLKIRKEALGKASDISVFFSSNPCQAALSRRFLQTAIFIWLFLCDISLIDRIRFGLRRGTVSAQHFRMSISDPEIASSSSGGPLFELTEVSLRHALIRNSQGNETISFPESVRANGWWLEVDSKFVDRLVLNHWTVDNVRLDTSIDGFHWDWLLQNSAVSSLSGWPCKAFVRKMQSQSDVPHATSLRPNRDIIVLDFGVGWAWYIDEISNFLSIVCFYVLLGHALAGNLRTAVLWGAAAGFSNSFLSFLRVVIPLYVPFDPHLYRILRAVQGVANLVIAFGWWHERYFVISFLVFNCLKILEGVIMSQFYGVTVGIVYYIQPGFMVVFCTGILILRIWIVQRARELVSGHKSAYDRVWNELVQSDKNVQILKQMHNLILAQGKSNQVWQMQVAENEQLSGGRASFSIRELFPKWLPGFGVFSRVVTAASWSISSTKSNGYARSEDEGLVPISSLDQLYKQGGFMRHILLEKLQGYALKCRGSFPGHSDGISTPAFPQEIQFHRSIPTTPQSYIRWSEALVDPQKMAMIKWPPVKRVYRSIEKAARSYGDKVSQLLDIARALIVFDEVSDLFECLSTILSDPEVSVLRIKNRMSFQYDGWQSLGYRDVCLNLNIINDVTREYETYLHVMEVQLILKKFMEQKSDDGHRCYVAYRNLVGH